MSAYLEVEEQGPPGYRIADAGPAHAITLAAEPLPGLQASPGEAEVQQALRKAGVVMGVNQGAIARALASPVARTVQVAAGRPASGGRPGRVESLLPEEAADTLRSLSLRVEPGQPLARLTPAQPGEAGYDVSGNRLEPEPPPTCLLTAGSGVQLSADGTEAVATICGRPVILEVDDGVYRAAVVPVAEWDEPPAGPGDTYRFEGDVVINGNLGGGVTISAGGWIWVRGRVEHARLTAGQGIWVERSAEWSHLTTHATRRRLAEFQRKFSSVESDLRQMKEYAGLIADHPRYPELARVRTFGEVILFLTRQQFAELHERLCRAGQMLAELPELQAHVDLQAILNVLKYRVFAGNLRSVDEFTEFIDTLSTAAQRALDILGAGGVDAPVHARVLIGSEVRADGDVIIHGSGAEQSVIRARGRIQATSLRAVRAVSAEAIETEAVAALSPDSLALEVESGGHLWIGLALQQAHLRVGTWRGMATPETRNLLIRSDAAGHVHISSHARGSQGLAPVFLVRKGYTNEAGEAG